MNERTRARIASLEGALTPEDEPRELRVLVTERTFADRATLAAWTREGVEQRRARRGAESADVLRVVVVSIGDEHERDLGPAARRPAKALPS